MPALELIENRNSLVQSLSTDHSSSTVASTDHEVPDHISYVTAPSTPELVAGQEPQSTQSTGAFDDIDEFWE